MSEHLLENKEKLAEKVQYVAREIGIHEMKNGNPISTLQERIDMAILLLSFNLYDKEELTEEEMVAGSDIIRRALTDYIEN